MIGAADASQTPFKAVFQVQTGRFVQPTKVGNASKFTCSHCGLLQDTSISLQTALRFWINYYVQRRNKSSCFLQRIQEVMEKIL